MAMDTQEMEAPGGTPPIAVVILNWNGEKLLEKGTMCKMARGRMVRWLAENNITDPEDIRYFADLNYQFAPAHSTENNYVFIQGGT